VEITEDSDEKEKENEKEEQEDGNFGGLLNPIHSLVLLTG